MVETLAVTIESDDETDEITLPAALVERLAEPDEAAATVVADVALMSFAGRAHALLHHAQGEPDDDLREAEADVMDRFEERFGVTYAEATGHSH